MLRKFTNEGVTRTAQIASAGLVFVVTTIAYGTGGYNGGTPQTPIAIDPAATSLIAEVYRCPVKATDVVNTVTPRGREVTYTSLGGQELPAVSGLGEAGLFATVTVPGTTGLSVGYTFLLVLAHFPRQILGEENERLAIYWPLDYAA